MSMKHKTRLTWRSWLLRLGLLGLMCSLFQPLAGRFNLHINDTVKGQSIITTPAVEGTADVPPAKTSSVPSKPSWNHLRRANRQHSEDEDGDQ